MCVCVCVWRQDGRTALHHAMLYGIVNNDLSIVRCLIDRGADVNVKDQVRASLRRHYSDATIV